MTAHEKSRVALHLRQAAALRNICVSLARARRVPLEMNVRDNSAGTENSSSVREEAQAN